MKSKQTEPPHEDEDSALTLDQQRERLAEKIFRIINEMEGAPKRCRAPICKRTRRCAHPSLICEADAPPKPPISEEEAANNLFEFKKVLEAEVARRAALREAESAEVAHRHSGARAIAREDARKRAGGRANPESRAPNSARAAPGFRVRALRRAPE